MLPQWSREDLAKIFRAHTVIRVSGTDYTVIYQDLGKPGFHRTGSKDPTWQAEAVLHDHSLPELHVVLSGKGGLLLSCGERLSLEPGDCLLIGKRVKHVLSGEGGRPMTRFEVQLNWDPDRGDRPFPRFLEETRIRLWHGCGELVSLANTIGDEGDRGLPGGRARLQAHLTLMLTELMLLSGAREPEEDRKDGVSMETVDLMAIDNILAKNHSFTAEELARCLHISERQLYRLLKKYSGESFKQKLVGYRIETAKELLNTTALAVEEVAVRVGYDNISSFTRAFRKAVGTTPGAFRNQKTN